MYKISDNTIQAIKNKTPWGHSAFPQDEGLNEEEIKGLFYKAITDSKDSVISEINRIVDEANRELEVIDNVDRIGMIENCHLAPEKQHWMRVKNILFIYGDVKLYSAEEVEAFGDVINMNVGNNSLFKVTAPYNVIPDENLTVTVQDKTYSGLVLLRNSAEEALNGQYYFYIAINKSDESINNISIKWNTVDEPKQLLAFFSNVGSASSTTEKKLFFKYSANSNGDNMTSNYRKELKYLGLAYSESEPELASSYTWVRIKTNQMVWYTATVLVSSWNGGAYQDYYVKNLKTTSHVFVTFPSKYYETWAKCGLRCEVIGPETIRVHCKEAPSLILIQLLIGDMDNDI